MERAFLDVLEFHRVMAPDLIGTVPAVPSQGSADLRMRLVCEETYELEQAMERGDLPAVADAIADAIYVLLGCAVTCGIDMRPVWDAVHAANMAKVGGAIREDGKRLKPDGWTPPDIAGILGRQPPLTTLIERPNAEEIETFQLLGLAVAAVNYGKRIGCSLVDAIEAFRVY